jgi:small GTP-binding protein
MFSCFGPKYKLKHAIIIGLENSGKTSLLYRTKFDGYNDIISTQPTIGFNRELITFNDSRHKVKLTLTDLPGVEDLRSIWPVFINNDVDGIVFVIDAERVLTDNEYLFDCKDCFWELLDTQHELDTCPVIIFLNKMDKAKNVINKINKMANDIKNPEKMNSNHKNSNKNSNRYTEHQNSNQHANECFYFNDLKIDLNHFDQNGMWLSSKWVSAQLELEQLTWRSYLVQPCSANKRSPKVMDGMWWLVSKMASKTQGKDKPFYGENKTRGSINLSRRDSTHVVTRRHKKYKTKPVYKQPSIILKQEYFEPEIAENESVVESVVESIVESTVVESTCCAEYSPAH